MNVNWACFRCRSVVRRSASTRDVRCPHCGEPCRSGGTKIRFPPRHHLKAWLRLRRWLAASRLADCQRAERALVARQHLLERQLVSLPRRPTNPDRDRTIWQLRRRLAGA